MDDELRNILRAWLYFGYSFQMFCHEEAERLKDVSEEELKAVWEEERIKKGA